MRTPASETALSPASERETAKRILQSVKMLAAAFPRSAWRAESDAAYTMGLMSAGIAPDEASVAVRNLVHESTELPTVADVIAEVRRLRTQATVAAFRCPECGSDLVAAFKGVVLLCWDCDWERSRRPEGE